MIKAIYLNDIHEAVPGDKLKLYADDTNLFVCGSNLQSVADETNPSFKVK